MTDAGRARCSVRIESVDSAAVELIGAPVTIERAALEMQERACEFGCCPRSPAPISPR